MTMAMRTRRPDDTPHRPGLAYSRGQYEASSVSGHQSHESAGRPKRLNHRWTEEEREYVRTHYSGDNASADDIAAHLGVTRYAVKGQVSSLGCAKITDRKGWTPQEEERLAELIGQHCPRRIAKMMHRSINSVVVKSKRLGLSSRVRDGWYTKREVAEILGVDHKWVQRRIDRGELQASWHHGHRPQQDGAGSWHIEEKAVSKFIRTHCMELNGRNVDLPAIVMMLAPVNGDPDR